MLNVVNFGGGSYVLYAEVHGDQIEVDPEPYGDNFARPARLLPLEAKALVAAIDLIGEHLPEGSLDVGAREDRRRARAATRPHEGLQITTAKGDDSEIARVCRSAIAERRLLEIEYYKENEDEFTDADDRALQADERARGLVRPLVGPDKDDAALVPPRPDPLGDGARRELRAARPGIEPDVHGWPTHRRGRRLRASRACGSRPSARAGRARTSAWSRSCRRRGGRRAALRGPRVPGARDPQGGGRRRRARARRGSRQAVLEAAEALAGAAKR